MEVPGMGNNGSGGTGRSGAAKVYAASSRPRSASSSTKPAAGESEKVV